MYDIDRTIIMDPEHWELYNLAATAAEIDNQQILYQNTEYAGLRYSSPDVIGKPEELISAQATTVRDLLTLSECIPYEQIAKYSLSMGRKLTAVTASLAAYAEGRGQLEPHIGDAVISLSANNPSLEQSLLAQAHSRQQQLLETRRQHFISEVAEANLLFEILGEKSWVVPQLVRADKILSEIRNQPISVEKSSDTIKHDISRPERVNLELSGIGQIVLHYAATGQSFTMKQLRQDVPEIAEMSPVEYQKFRKSFPALRARIAFLLDWNTNSPSEGESGFWECDSSGPTSMYRLKLPKSYTELTDFKNRPIAAEYQTAKATVRVQNMVAAEEARGLRRPSHRVLAARLTRTGMPLHEARSFIDYLVRTKQI